MEIFAMNRLSPRLTRRDDNRAPGAVNPACRASTLPSHTLRRIVRDVNYSVLFRQFPLDHLDALAPIVARTSGITDFDARTKIRKGWGFLDRNATEEQARRVVEALG